MSTNYPRHPRTGTSAALKAAANTFPPRPTMELFATIPTPHDFRPLLRPDGPYLGSGV